MESCGGCRLVQSLAHERGSFDELAKFVENVPLRDCPVKVNHNDPDVTPARYLASTFVLAADLERMTKLVEDDLNVDFGFDTMSEVSRKKYENSNEAPDLIPCIITDRDVIDLAVSASNKTICKGMTSDAELHVRHLYSYKCKVLPKDPLLELRHIQKTSALLYRKFVKFCTKDALDISQWDASSGMLRAVMNEPNTEGVTRLSIRGVPDLVLHGPRSQQQTAQIKQAQKAVNKLVESVKKAIKAAASLKTPETIALAVDALDTLILAEHDLLKLSFPSMVGIIEMKLPPLYHENEGDRSIAAEPLPVPGIAKKRSLEQLALYLVAWKQSMKNCVNDGHVYKGMLADALQSRIMLLVDGTGDATENQVLVFSQTTSVEASAACVELMCLVDGEYLAAWAISCDRKNGGTAHNRNVNVRELEPGEKPKKWVPRRRYPSAKRI